MKKSLFALLTTLLLCFLVSCSFNFDSVYSQTKPTTDEQSSSQTDESVTDSADSTAEDTSSDTPDTGIHEDYIDYSLLVKEGSDNTYLYAGFEFEMPKFTNYYHNYSSAISLTFDDGYNMESARYVSSFLKQYNIHATAMISPCFIAGNDTKINQWNEILKEGILDVGAHGYDHISPDGMLDSEVIEKETKGAQDFLRETFPSQHVITFATPFATSISPDYLTSLKKYFISNRQGEGGQAVQLSGNIDRYNIGSYVATKYKSASEIEQGVTSLTSKGKWAVLLLHSVMDEPVNSTDISKSVFESFIPSLYNTYKDKVWFASFEEVSIYQMQKETASVNYLSADKEKMTFNITCDLDKNIYNIPMTVKIYLPKFCDTAYAKIGDTEQNTFIGTEFNKKYIIVYDCPVNGENIEVYLGGNSNCLNGCDHLYRITNTVNPSCNQRGYTEKQCELCGNTYKFRYTSTLNHKFSDWTISQDGSKKERKCTVCEYTESKQIDLQNIAQNATLSGTDSKNDYCKSDLITDGSNSTFYQSNQGSGTYVILDFSKETKVQKIQVLVSNYKKISWIQDINDGNSHDQIIKISIFNGQEWIEKKVWKNSECASSDEILTVDLEEYMSLYQIKIEFVQSEYGASNIYEAIVLSPKE